MNAPNIKPSWIIVRPQPLETRTVAEQGGVPQDADREDFDKLVSEFEQSGRLCGVQLQRSGVIFSH